jgi:hypothetical protein
LQNTREISHPNASLKYDLIKIPDYSNKLMGLMFRRGSVFTEEFSVIAAERLSYIQHYMSFPIVDKQCKDHLFPEERDVSAEFMPIVIGNVEGVFGFWIFALSISACAFVFELIYRKYIDGRHFEEDTLETSLKMHINLEVYRNEDKAKFMKICYHYDELLKLLN